MGEPTLELVSSREALRLVPPWEALKSERTEDLPAQFGQLWSLVKMLSAFANLGDERLNKRFVQIVEESLAAQSCALSALATPGGKASHKALQRFLSNERAQLWAMREALYQVSLEQVRQAKNTSVLAIYDPTNLDFSAQQRRKKGLKPVGKAHVPGYIWLNVALVDPDSGRLLGVAHQTLDSAKGPDDQEYFDYDRGVDDPEIAQGFATNPKQQFLTHARAVDELVAEELELINVADREFDDAFALRGLAQLSERRHFVIRSDEQRVVQVRRAPWIPGKRRVPSRQRALRRSKEKKVVDIYLRDVVLSVPLRPFGSVALDGRGRVSKGRRPARIAKLSIGAVPIRLARRSERGQRAFIEEQPMWLHLVVVRELRPPKGKEPLQWTLLTDLPITTREEKSRVVRIYESRIRIEEFFRTTNDGLKLEASRLDDPTSTARLLVLVTFKAMFLDALRAAAGIAAGTPPSKEQRKALERGAAEAQRIESQRRTKAKRTPKLSRRQRAIMLLGLLARHGGWESRNGSSLGNYILLRGLHGFLPLVCNDLYLWLFDEVGW